MKQNDDITGRPDDDLDRLRARFGGSFDLSTRTFTAAGRTLTGVYLDGMCDEKKITDAVLAPLCLAAAPAGAADAAGFAEYVRASLYLGAGIAEAKTLENAGDALLKGAFVLLLPGVPFALACSVPGFAKKSVDAPETEQNEAGAKESFTDDLKDNGALLRRRLRTPKLVLEADTLGTVSKTQILYCYLSDRADAETLKKVKKRLHETTFACIPGTGALKPYLENRTASLFSAVGSTERPDVLAAMLCEGRIAVLADGSPFALIVPYLLIDHFRTADDRMAGGVYALFIRLLRTLGFVISTVLPGFFTAVCTFHPEVLPAGIMLDIAAAEASTPLSLTAETLTIHLIYEIVREAGIRIPRAAGPAVSIVGALVVGDAAVRAELIASPMLMIVALTAISSAMSPKLHESTAIIRLTLIVLGGTTGFFGLFTGIGAVLALIVSDAPYGVPFSAPFAPFSLKKQSDALLQALDERTKHDRIRELKAE